jgi:hypothetical protein
MDQRHLKPTSDENTFQADPTIDLERQTPRPDDGNGIDGLRALALGALAAGMLLWVALYNGYPTVFSDTGGYLWTGVYHVAIPPFRAPGYSVFANLASLGRSAWLIVAAQSILVVYVLYETCDYLIGGSRAYLARCFFAVSCVLAALTSLPWLVSLLMPDVFAGVFFLCAFLLAFAAELSFVRRMLLALILSISVSAHLSLFPIAALFISALLLLRFVGRETRELPSARSVALWLLVPILSAGLWTATMNQKEGVGFRLSPSKNEFLLGRLFGNGLAADFLRANCPQRPLISCQYLSNLPRNEEEFLFQHPLVHDLEGHDDEIGTIVRGTISAYPLRLAISSAQQTLHQLGALRTGDEIRSYSAKEWNNYAILQVFSGEVPRFWSSRQFRDRLAPAANAVASVHTPVFWLSLAACLLFAWAGRFARMNRFLASAAIFLVLNAAICGALAGVYDRYQGRVAWIIPFCLCGYFCCWAREWKFKGAREEAISSWAHTETQSHRPHPVRTATPGDSENIPAEG